MKQRATGCVLATWLVVLPGCPSRPFYSQGPDAPSEGTPAAITPDAVTASRMRLGQAGPDGRRAPEVDAGGDFTAPADLVIKALGFDAEDLPGLFGAPDLSVTRWGTLRVDHKTMMTSLPGVFAAGDIVRGASLVVWAVRDGRDVATHMHHYLRAQIGAAAVAA